MTVLSSPATAALVLALRDRYKTPELVETGTYRGESTSWAAQHFDLVTTIDIRRDFQEETIERLGTENIAYLLGDSREQLLKCLEVMDSEPAIFWLDAHNANQLFGSGADDCPIMEELEAIFMHRESHKLNHCILIDDAHCFVPPLPYDATKWPEISLIKEVAANNGYITGVAHDIIVLVPPEALPDLEAFTGAAPLPSNEASCRMPVHKVNFHFNIQPQRMISRGVMVQGDQKAQGRPAPNYRNISIIADTAYGKMILPAHDANQTPSLCSGPGVSLDWDDIDRLIALIKMRPGAVFIDVGANVGCFSFAMQPYCSKIYAYEAQPMLAYMMGGSIALNGWENIVVVNGAIGRFSRALAVPKFDYAQLCSFGSIEFGGEQREPLHQKPGIPDQSIGVYTLDSLFEGATRIDMIKIDVEGMEMEVIEGAAAILQEYHPILFIEHQKSGTRVIRKRLRELGYNFIRDVGNDFLAQFIEEDIVPSSSSL